jgi:hypothetical protein
MVGALFCEIRAEHSRSAFELASKLNDDRQGEGGTLAVIVVNITTRIYFMQEFVY